MNGTIRYTIRPYDTLWIIAQVFNTTVDSIMELNPRIEPRNLQNSQVITIRPGYQSYPSYPNDMADNNVVSKEIVDLMNYLRMLWEQHVTWTANVVSGLVHDLPETDLMIQRLLRNPQDFATVLASFYGEEGAQTFAELLSSHIAIAAELVQAATAEDNEAYADAEQRWYENADQIAAFLASINPNWYEDDWNAMLYEHLNLLGTYVANMVAENYEEAISGYDDIEMQALEMADMMAEGIKNQFV